MQFTTSVVAAIMAFSASAAPLETRQTALKDWEISTFNWGSPSGRPGSYPFSTISTTVQDPNSLTLTSTSGANVTLPAGEPVKCTAQWFTSETPLDHTWPCDQVSSGYWVMNILPGANGFSRSDFKVKFTHNLNQIYQGQQLRDAQYEATTSFGTNNLATQCGGSGVCSYYLRDEFKPVLAAPERS